MPVPEQILNDPDIDTLLQQMRGEAVPKCMDRDRLIEASSVSGIAKDALDLARRDRPGWLATRKQPVGRALLLPIRAQQIEKLIRQHHVAVFATFALPHVD